MHRLYTCSLFGVVLIIVSTISVMTVVVQQMSGNVINSAWVLFIIVSTISVMTVVVQQMLGNVIISAWVQSMMTNQPYTVSWSLQAVIEGYLRPMLAHNWDRGSLYSYRAFSFPSDMPYEEIRQPVMFITGEKDQPLTKGARKVIFGWQKLYARLLLDLC